MQQKFYAKQKATTFWFKKPNEMTITTFTCTELYPFRSPCVWKQIQHFDYKYKCILQYISLWSVCDHYNIVYTSYDFIHLVIVPKHSQVYGGLVFFLDIFNSSCSYYIVNSTRQNPYVQVFRSNNYRNAGCFFMKDDREEQRRDYFNFLFLFFRFFVLL